ncbi:hypothetical protein C8R47DRAFT_1071657 [Mycena vitilis]|nr:hypothetical protein C8R47DRAFT_1071657 [Mycena vitilis]
MTLHVQGDVGRDILALRPPAGPLETLEALAQGDSLPAAARPATRGGGKGGKGSCEERVKMQGSLASLEVAGQKGGIRGGMEAAHQRQPYQPHTIRGFVDPDLRCERADCSSRLLEDVLEFDPSALIFGEYFAELFIRHWRYPPLFNFADAWTAMAPWL